MMANHRLTHSRIDKYCFDPAGPSRQILFDSQLSGFGVRAYRSGRKVYVLQYGDRSKRRLMVLGPCTDGRDVGAVRAGAQGLLLKHKSEGIDPLNEQLKAEADTVRAVVEAYIEARTPDWSATEARHSESRLNGHIDPRIGTVRLEKLTRREMRAMHRKMTEKAPYEANRTLQLVRASINFALSDGGWRPADLVEGENPATRIKLNKEKARREWVQPDEIPNLLKAIDAEKNPWMRAFFRMVLYTGARKGELLNLKWSDVDLKRGIIVFVHTKNREDHEVPLPPAAVKLLQSIPKMLGNPYVLCGHIAGKPIHNPYKPWARILERAGIERRITIHDLRRTVGSLLASEGYSTQQIGKLLNHKSAITAKVYAEIADQSKREMTDAMEKMLQ